MTRDEAEDLVVTFEDAIKEMESTATNRRYAAALSEMRPARAAIIAALTAAPEKPRVDADSTTGDLFDAFEKRAYESGWAASRGEAYPSSAVWEARQACLSRVFPRVTKDDIAELVESSKKAQEMAQWVKDKRAPRVDVRKVVRWYAETVGVTLDENVMTAALRAAGVEVVE